MNDTPALQVAMKRCYQLGQAKYPDIRWGLAEFEQTWGTYALSPSSDEAGQVDYLRLACLAGRPGAVEILEQDFIRPLRGTISAVCKDADLAEEALQMLREKLLVSDNPKLASYRRSGNFRAWLRVVAAHTALDSLRGRSKRSARELELSERLEGIATGPEGHFLREEFREVFSDALKAAVRSLPKRERRALRMHLVSHWSITQIGRVFSVHRATAARWLVSAREQLSQALRDELSRRLESGSEDVELILSEMKSRLDVRISQLFSAPTTQTVSGVAGMAVGDEAEGATTAKGTGAKC